MTATASQLFRERQNLAGGRKLTTAKRKKLSTFNRRLGMKIRYAKVDGDDQAVARMEAERVQYYKELAGGTEPPPENNLPEPDPTHDRELSRLRNVRSRLMKPDDLPKQLRKKLTLFNRSLGIKIGYAKKRGELDVAAMLEEKREPFYTALKKEASKEQYGTPDWMADEPRQQNGEAVEPEPRPDGIELLNRCPHCGIKLKPIISALQLIAQEAADV